MMNTRMKLLAVVLAALSVSPAWAQTDATAMPMTTDDAMPAMDHSGMDHSTMPDMPAVQPEMKHDMSDSMGGMLGMDHGNASAPQQSMDGMSQGGNTMDQGKMNMQGGSAPADARDPHAYSGGYTLESGPYSRPGPRELRLGDEHNFGSLLVDRLERGYTRDSNDTAYDMQAWFGRDYDRLVFKAEGDIAKGKLQEARTELLWGHAIATFWDTQAGMRYDSGVGPDRGWLAFGVQGLAPYWFGVDAAAYVGNNGRTALRLGTEYELLLTQKLVLQPRVEVNWYGKSDAVRGVGAGLSEAQAGLRLRYEFTRQFAPYIGVERTGKFGQTANLARAEGESTGVTRWVAGVRFWF
ncbi:copper resistance protein B [Sulfuricella denitrificans]|nr:copper resistance protein B [Sulfuricella denitrificans]